ncbi:MAG TPA: flavin reductase [Actinobacteria bacterium]|nr:flavin-dependent monooxygenase, reductase subunit HsaB [bacterium BMS3Bbin02]HDL41746.1 flavin reductase [Actinomycetota bacterium]
MESDQFRGIMRQLAAGVTVVTSRDGTEPVGMTVSAFTSVAVDPPLILVCLTIGGSTTKAVSATNKFTVNILADNQAALSNRFAFIEQDERFDGLDWTWSDIGTPRLSGLLAHLDCEVADAVVAGDHVVFIGAVVGGDRSEGRPLVYTNGGYHRPEPIQG